MVLDLTSLLNGTKSKLDFAYEIPMDDGENALLPPDDVSFTAPISVRGTITDNAGYMALSATASLPYHTHCARCLQDIFGTFVFEFNRTVANSDTLQNQDSDEYVVVKNGRLDIDRELSEYLLLEFPSRFLCQEECAGLCPKCGKNLNFGPCDCPKQKEIDPRLAILQKLLEKE